MNKYLEEEDPVDFEAHPYEAGTGKRQLERLEKVKTSRDSETVTKLLKDLKTLAQDPDTNLLPVTIEAVKARATLGEICDSLRDLWGTYRETPVI